ncbi:MAG: ferredoxin-thioredoxin reductase catalytic domain-containing protein [Candidatus Pacebacteria bacterium]|nr:ferredoxin-thioredoxin reductase catalytic domain-containing protein [Candidatus Paceibacterota bacterium]
MEEKELKQKTAELISFYEKYAKENGFKLNPNRKIVEGVVRALIMKNEAFGAKYCPCRKLGNDKKANKKIICPCAYHKEEIEKEGHCYCNLFVK